MSKRYLDYEGVEKIVEHFHNDLDQKADKTDLSAYALKSDIPEAAELMEAITEAELNQILYGGICAVVSDLDGFINVLNSSDEYEQITLTDNITLNESLMIPASKTVILDLNNKELTCEQPLVVEGEAVIKNGAVSAAGRPLFVRNGGKLTISSSNITSSGDCAVSASGEGTLVTVDSGLITAQEVPVLVTSKAAAVINGGTLMGKDNFAIGGNGTAGQGEVDITINGGTIIGHIQSAGYIAAGVYMPNSGRFTMNGGEIISDGAGIVMRGGEVILNGGSVAANGASGVKGKVGDSRVVVGPYAVVYDANSKYPAMNTLALTIGKDMVLNGTDGDIDTILIDGVEANITDNRE